MGFACLFFAGQTGEEQNGDEPVAIGAADVGKEMIADPGDAFHLKRSAGIELFEPVGDGFVDGGIGFAEIEELEFFPGFFEEEFEETGDASGADTAEIFPGPETVGIGDDQRRVGVMQKIVEKSFDRGVPFIIAFAEEDTGTFVEAVEIKCHIDAGIGGVVGLAEGTALEKKFAAVKFCRPVFQSVSGGKDLLRRDLKPVAALMKGFFFARHRTVVGQDEIGELFPFQ